MEENSIFGGVEIEVGGRFVPPSPETSPTRVQPVTKLVINSQNSHEFVQVENASLSRSSNELLPSCQCYIAVEPPNARSSGKSSHDPSSSLRSTSERSTTCSRNLHRSGPRSGEQL